ncbi:MAG: hypothetical protein JWO31_571 [Phycisphaerales bacterium]|nr:hypothetical protein [Phycisphaerales bacterium]
MSSNSKGGMHGGKDRKLKGRSSITKILEPSPTHPIVPQIQVHDVNRGVTANGNMNKHRGDRRDTNPHYTGNRKHASRGNNARRDVTTRGR